MVVQSTPSAPRLKSICQCSLFGATDPAGAQRGWGESSPHGGPAHAPDTDMRTGPAARCSHEPDLSHRIRPSRGVAQGREDRQGARRRHAARARARRSGEQRPGYGRRRWSPCFLLSVARRRGAVRYGRFTLLREIGIDVARMRGPVRPTEVRSSARSGAGDGHGDRAPCAVVVPAELGLR